jgi:uncharacterized protein (TIGR03086 family)
MDTTNELRARALDGFRERVRGVGEGQWDDPTPCTEWTVRDLVQHVASELLWSVELGRGASLAEVGDRFEGDVLRDDPQGVVERAVEASVETFRGDHAEEIDTTQGSIPVEHYLTQMLVDALVHSWDLAVATGQDAALDPGLCTEVYRRSVAAHAEIEGARQVGVFGPEVEVDADASHQDKLLALLGRDPS